MTLTDDRPTTTSTPTDLDRPVTITRRKIDTVLVGLGATIAVVLLVAAGLLRWGSTFAEDYVSDELAAQNISFPPAEALTEDGRDDLLPYAGELVDTGAEAEAYASFIEGHIADVADGATYADLGRTEREAKAALNEAMTAGADADEVAALEEAAAEITGQRDTIFRGEMLRGTLLSTYAWSTIGRIAGIASLAALAGAVVMGALVVAGTLHLRRLHAR